MVAKFRFWTQTTVLDDTKQKVFTFHELLKVCLIILVLRPNIYFIHIYFSLRYGNHRWVVMFLREDKKLGINLIWKNVSEVSRTVISMYCLSHFDTKTNASVINAHSDTQIIRLLMKKALTSSVYNCGISWRRSSLGPGAGFFELRTTRERATAFYTEHFGQNRLMQST